MSLKKVKIVPVALGVAKTIKRAEDELSSLLADGWLIVTSGGGTGKVLTDVAGFVILVKDE